MDIEFMTNEEINPVDLIQYLMEHPPPKQTHSDATATERALKNRQLGDGT